MATTTSIPPSRKHCMPVWQRTNFSMTARRGPPTYMSDSPFCYAKRQGPRARQDISHVPQPWTTIENWRIKRTDRGLSKTQKPRVPILGTRQNNTEQCTASWSGHRTGAWLRSKCRLPGNGRSVVHVQVMIMSKCNGSHHRSGWKCWNYSGLFMHIERFEWLVEYTLINNLI